MPIRVRLALWYAGLTSAAVIVLVATAYVVHNRESYEDVDRSLMNAAEHYSPQFAFPAPGGAAPSRVPQDSTVLVRLYGKEGTALRTSPEVPAPPLLDARETLNQDAGPLYDRFIRWFPGGQTFGQGAFATVREPATDTRIRFYVLPIQGDDGVTGYVQTWSALDSLDRSMRNFRYLMLGLAATAVVAVFVGSFLIAGQALRPISTMIHTAREIAHSRGFSRRLPEPSRRDELGELALTFNEMVTSLDDAYRSQQRFIADAAHELRAPLTAIQGNIELLARMPDMPDEERTEALTYIDSEARRLARIVGELLTLARADAGQSLERHRLDLDRVLLDVLVDLRHAAERHRIELARLDPVAVEGDADRLKQLLFNLLDNSMKYTPTHGSIAVGLERRGAKAVLTVRDDGVGISSEALPHVFDRFFRADPSRGRDPSGTGLGLAISKWIVDQHQGSIAIESSVGRGTSVTVDLPALTDDRPDSAGMTPAPAVSTTRRRSAT